MSIQDTPPASAGAMECGPQPAPRPLSPELLTDEALADLGPEAIQAIRAAVDDSESRTLAMAIRMVTEVLERDRLCYPARLAQGLLQEKLEDPTPAVSTYVVLARDLLAAGNLGAARWVARRGLLVRGDHRFVDVLLRVAERLPETADDDLEFCRQHLPTAPELLWHDSLAADLAGEPERAADLAVDAALGFAAIDAADEAEEAVLRALECDNPTILARLVRGLPSMLAHKKGREVLDLTLELGWSVFEDAGLQNELAEALKRILLRQGDDPVLRARFVSALSGSLGGERAVGGLLDRAGITDFSVPFADALDRYEALATYLPGTHVLNADWGIGRVVAHDGENLTIDFQRKAGHRLGLSIAETALSVVPDNLVAVAYFEDPEGILRERDEDPAALVLRAVHQAGGAITVKELKEILTREIVPPTEWATWWRRAREALRSEPRIDSTQSFHDVIRLAPEGGRGSAASEVDIPILDTKRGLKSAVLMISRLLKEHPEVEDRARTAYADALAIGLAQERRHDARLAALAWLVRWKPSERAMWIREAGQAIDAGGDICSIIDAEAQKAVMDLALESPAWPRAAVAGLRSKHRHVVEAAWSALVSREPAEVRAILEGDLTTSPPSPSTVLMCQVLLSGWAELAPPLRPQPWLVLEAILKVAAAGSPSQAAQSARRLIATSEALQAALREAGPPSTAMGERIRQIVRRPADEGFGDEVMELLRRAGYPTLATAIQADDEAVTDEVPDLPEFDDEVTLMTRGTLAIMKGRVRTNRERLRVVQDDLEKARSFGDLSENSEYETAREQRALLEATIGALSQDLGRARFIEDLEVEPGVVRAGTQVILRDSGGERTIWLLGEGDSHLGDNVVSYRAPLGRALVGHREGDRVHFTLGDEETEIEILSVQRRLP